MRKIAFATIAALGIATLATPAADARPGVRGGTHSGGHVARRGGGISRGAAVGLGIAGLAAGAYGNRYDRPVGYGDGYGRGGYERRGGYGYGGGGSYGGGY